MNMYECGVTNWWDCKKGIEYLCDGCEKQMQEERLDKRDFESMNEDIFLDYGLDYGLDDT